MSDINALGFGSTVDMLSNALTGAGMQHQAISENIANVNTPNYGRQSVSFKEALAAAQQTPADPDLIAMKTDDDRQFAIGGPQAAAPFNPQIQVDKTQQMRADGSNVDVDQEMAELSQNSAYSQTMAQLLQGQFKRIREAVTEQPN
ncbi:MAG: flagellar basal body rod protein FlgB [Vulcanimicrobiaceae bacterium]